MTVLQYTLPLLTTTPTRRRRLAGLGTSHNGPQWTATARLIRATIVAAREAAPTRRAPSAERIADAVIDGIDSLAASDRAVLGVVVGALLRGSKN